MQRWKKGRPGRGDRPRSQYVAALQGLIRDTVVAASRPSYLAARGPLKARDRVLATEAGLLREPAQKRMFRFGRLGLSPAPERMNSP
jgi:hypothetical protein